MRWRPRDRHRVVAFRNKQVRRYRGLSKEWHDQHSH